MSEPTFLVVVSGAATAYQGRNRDRGRPGPGCRTRAWAAWDAKKWLLGFPAREPYRQSSVFGAVVSMPVISLFQVLFLELFVSSSLCRALFPGRWFSFPSLQLAFPVLIPVDVTNVPVITARDINVRSDIQPFTIPRFAFARY